jgi:hypothetical protein
MDLNLYDAANPLNFKCFPHLEYLEMKHIQFENYNPKKLNSCIPVLQLPESLQSIIAHDIYPFAVYLFSPSSQHANITVATFDFSNRIDFTRSFKYVPKTIKTMHLEARHEFDLDSIRLIGAELKKQPVKMPNLELITTNNLHLLSWAEKWVALRRGNLRVEYRR